MADGIFMCVRLGRSMLAGALPDSMWIGGRMAKFRFDVSNAPLYVLAWIVSHPHVYRFDVSKAPADVLNWIRSHPGQTALIIVNVGVTSFIFFNPAALTVPLLASMGFGAQGPMAGSIAAWLQACIGNVGAKSAFAYLQSAGMAGYGVPVINGITQACAVAGSAGQAAACWCWGGNKPKSEAPPQPEDDKSEAPPQKLGTMVDIYIDEPHGLN